MSNEHNFKVGDKVATTKPYDIAINGSSFAIPIGEEGVIEDISNDDLYVYFSEYHIYLTFPIWDVELIAPLDRKIAFLTRLQSLLREFDAKIEPEFNSYADMGIVSILVGGEYVVESVDTITADNIMDFDKE